jgi:hypothetical protein
LKAKIFSTTLRLWGDIATRHITVNGDRLTA